MKFTCGSYILCTHDVKVLLHNIFVLWCYDGNPPQEVRCRISHCSIRSAQKVLEFEELWILRLLYYGWSVYIYEFMFSAK